MNWDQKQYTRQIIERIDWSLIDRLFYFIFTRIHCFLSIQFHLVLPISFSFSCAMWSGFFHTQYANGMNHSTHFTLFAFFQTIFIRCLQFPLYPRNIQLMCVCVCCDNSLNFSRTFNFYTFDHSTHEFLAFCIIMKMP